MHLREGMILAALLWCSECSAQAAAPAMSASAVQAAAEVVKADPLLPGKEKTKVLRFKQDEHEPRPEQKADERWWRELLGNLSAGMRVAVWLVGAGLLIWVLLRLRDWLKQRAGGSALPAQPPTHVGTLDIRPESLPADIGDAARALWQGGELRAALSLLYRGALSRLAHGHGVPIRAASTESECLALAATRLTPASQSFLAQLVAGWQTVAYARRQLSAADLEQLCEGFDAHLPCLPPTAAGKPA